MTSLRARTANLLIRLLVKRDLSRRPFTAEHIAALRGTMDSVAERNRLPAGHRFEETDFGGVPGEWVVPDALHHPRKVLLYLHGGAYAVGTPKFYRDLTWRLAESACCRVACIDYRLAPEHPWPAAPDDALAAYTALLEQGFEGRDIALAGDSAGGNLTLVTLQRIRAEGLPMPASAACFSPWSDLTGSGGSLITNARRDPMLPAHRLGEAAALYAPGQDLSDPLISPLFADYAGFPPLLLHVGSTEILLDDAVRVARSARDAGVDVSLEIWPGQAHVFQALARLVPEARTAVTEMGRFVHYHWLDAAEQLLSVDVADRDHRVA